MVKLNERGLNIATANYTANVDIGQAITAYLEHVESKNTAGHSLTESGLSLLMSMSESQINCPFCQGIPVKVGDVFGLGENDFVRCDTKGCCIYGFPIYLKQWQHQMSHPDTKTLLTDMRMQVSLTDRATMPIPLYERIKAAIAAISDERKAALQTGINACDIALENIKLKNAALREGK